MAHPPPHRPSAAARAGRTLSPVRLHPPLVHRLLPLAARGAEPLVRLGIIGGGRAAWAFGSTWRRIGWPIAGVTLREDLGRTLCAPTETDVATRTDTGGDTGRGAQ